MEWNERWRICGFMRSAMVGWYAWFVGGGLDRLDSEGYGGM